MAKLKPYIDFRLACLLADKAIINTPLAEVPPLAITDSTTILAKSFKEKWAPQHCKTSLASVEIYEAPNNPWQLNCTCPSFQGVEIAGAGASWAQLQVGMSTWSDSRFDASAAEASKKRWVYPSFIPTGVSSLVTVEKNAKEGSCIFTDLPMLAGHAILWSWYLRADEFFQELDAIESQALAADVKPSTREAVEQKLVKLWEAVMTASIRMRVSPQLTQILNDRLQWSEELRVTNAAAGDSFVVFTVTLDQYPELNLSTREWSGPKLARELSKLGLRFAGKEVSDACAKAILAAVPFFRKPVVLTAYRDLEAVTLTCGEQTKLMRMCQTVNKCYPKDPAAALCYAFEALRMNLAFEDLDQEDLSGAFLTGDPKNPQSVGFLAACATKMSHRDWLSHSIQLLGEAAAYQDLVREIKSSVDPRFNTPLNFWKNFGPSDGTDETQLLAAACYPAFETFRAGLGQEGSKLYADIKFHMFTNAYDEELLQIATQPNFQWHGYFKRKDDEEGEVTALQQAYAAYLTSLTSKPVAIPAAGAPPAAPVDVSGAAYSEQDQEERTDLYKKVCDLRRQEIELLGLPAGPATDPYKAGGGMERLYNDSRAAKFVGKAGESHRLTLLSQELCFSLKSIGAKDYKKPLPIDPHFKTAVEFAYRIRGAADVTLLSDGRNATAAEEICTALQGVGIDKKRLAKAWFHFRPPQCGDPRFPGNKYAYASNPVETASIVLPLAKNHMHAKARTDPYTGGLQLTTHTLTYVNVEPRTIGEMPRMAPSARAELHGATVAPTYDKAAILAAIRSGVSLLWMELHLILFYTVLYDHFDVKYICDLSPGSGAAAVAALMRGIKYTGLCKTEQHAKWLNQVLDTAYFAVLTDGGKGRDAAMSAKLLHYFGPVVDEALRMQRAQVHSAEEACDDDSGSS